MDHLHRQEGIFEAFVLYIEVGWHVALNSHVLDAAQCSGGPRESGGKGRVTAVDLRCYWLFAGNAEEGREGVSGSAV